MQKPKSTKRKMKEDESRQEEVSTEEGQRPFFSPSDRKKESERERRCRQTFPSPG